jgi:hypothetical protein
MFDRGDNSLECLIEETAANLGLSPLKLSSIPVHGEVYSIPHYVIKFVSDMRHVGGFLEVHRFPLPIRLTATIYMKYC